MLKYLDETSEENIVKNHRRRIINNNFINKECLTLTINSNVGHTTEEINFNFEQLNQIEIITNLVKDGIKPRILNHSTIDGEALFGVIESRIN